MLLHPLHKYPSRVRAVTHRHNLLALEQQDDLPEAAADEDYYDAPPPRKSAQRLVDISSIIADYGQPPRQHPSHEKQITAGTQIEEDKDPVGEMVVDGEDVGSSESNAEEQDEDGMGEGKSGDDDEEDEDEIEDDDDDDDEGSDLSEEFDVTPFEHDCLPEAAELIGE